MRLDTQQPSAAKHGCGALQPVEPVERARGFILYRESFSKQLSGCGHIAHVERELAAGGEDLGRLRKILRIVCRGIGGVVHFSLINQHGKESRLQRGVFRILSDRVLQQGQGANVIATFVDGNGISRFRRRGKHRQREKAKELRHD